MRPHPQPAGEPRLNRYRQIADRYLRYILIRALGVTNEPGIVQEIAVYALIVTCYLSDRVKRKADLGLVVETMVRIVAKDQKTSDKRKVTGEGSDKGQVISDKRGEAHSEPTACFSGDGPRPFVWDGPMCELAGAINALGRFERELLILHHIEGIDPAGLAEIHEMSAGWIESKLAKAEHEFVETLRGSASWDHEIEPDVHSILKAFGDWFDAGWVRDVAKEALAYLARHRGGTEKKGE